ncbi:MAG TPA: CBS domain-containing protein [Burkholderiales bacterium]|nr:CBS domain-containing protein [Burkholderiales bacterium]
MTTIGEICNREVIVAPPDTTVSAGAKLMRHHHVGSIVIVDTTATGPRRPIGLVTDRDIVVEVTAMDLDPNVLTLGDIMVRELITAREHDGVLETMEVMRYRGVRRIPVVTGTQQLVGIVTIDDLLEVLSEELAALTKIVAREQVREAAART